MTNHNPIIFVDMDGVLANLYGYAAEIHDVETYNEITPEQWQVFFKGSNAYYLFRDLPIFANANTLLSMIKSYAGGYNILSSPLSFDRAGSIKGKREWIENHIKVKPNKIIFEHEKYKYAVQHDTPNILIDDYGINITAWKNAGGIGIKFQNDQDSPDKIEVILKTVFGKYK